MGMEKNKYVTERCFIVIYGCGVLQLQHMKC